MSLYIKQTDTLTVYPYTIFQLRQDNPGTSFPDVLTDTDLADWSVYPVEPVSQPEYDAATQRVVEADPVRNEAGVFQQQWSVVDLSIEEIQQAAALAAEALQSGIVAATQQRLDDFARTRNYDGILSAATYATSAVPKFQAEGQYAVQSRDATWSRLYEVLAEVQAGTRPVPSGYADVEPLLPTLQWPL